MPSVAAAGTAHAATQSTAHARHVAKMAQAAHANHAAHRDRDRDAHSRAALAQAWAAPKTWALPEASGAKGGGGKAHGGPTRAAKPKAAAGSAVPAAAGDAATLAAAAAVESSECRMMQRTHQVVVGLSWGSLPPGLQKQWTQYHCDRRLRPSQGGASSTIQGGAG